MQNNIPYSYIYIRVLLTLLVMSFICTGCTKEDLSQCNISTQVLLFKAVVAVNGENQEIGSDVVKDISFYIFDENRQFLEVQQSTIGSIVSLEYPDQERLYVSCWGNSLNGNQVMPALEIGDNLEDAFVSVVVSGTKSTPEHIVTHPSDLFHSKSELLRGEGTDALPKEIILHRKVASVSIVTKGLPEYLNTPIEEITYAFRRGKRNINFQGFTAGYTFLTHVQKSEFNNGLYESSIFNILPSANTNAVGIEVDIYNGATIVATIKTDSGGNPIKAKEGELLNIYVVFERGNGDLNVNVAITPWGEKKIWKEF